MKLIAADDHTDAPAELQKVFDELLAKIAVEDKRSAILIVVDKEDNGMKAQLLSALPSVLTAIILSDLLRAESERLRAQFDASRESKKTTTH